MNYIEHIDANSIASHISICACAYVAGLCRKIIYATIGMIQSHNKRVVSNQQQATHIKSASTAVAL